MAVESSSSSTTTTTTTTSSTAKAIGNQTFKSVGDLIKLLPSGTVFLFQFLNPIVTNNGTCHVANKAVTGVLLFVCAFSCAFSSFTDSYVGTDGKTYYGVVTKTGLWSFWDPNSSSMDFSKYKLRFSDFVHAFFAVLVFAIISLLDSNSVSCFYPSFKSKEKAVLMALPPVIGGVAGGIFMVFPNTRHGIGYPASTSTTSSSSSSSA